MPIAKITKPIAYYTAISCASIELVAGLYTLIKILRSPQADNKWFGVVIAGGITGQGAALIGYFLSIIIYRYACAEFDLVIHTGGNFKYFNAFEGLNCICLFHFWVFTIKYLETGIKYTFLQSNLYLWVRYFLYFLILPYLVYIVGLYFWLTFSYPVFKPNATSQMQCIHEYQPY